MALIAPHGGKLVNRVLDSIAAAKAGKEAAALPSIRLSPREQFDLEMIAVGGVLAAERVHGRGGFPIVLQKYAVCRTAPCGRYP